MSEGLFYLQDSRTYVGNDMLFWAWGGGYTTNILKAEVFSKERALVLHRGRESDIPWPKEYIDARVRPAVDMQYCKSSQALRGTGIKLIKPKRQRKERYSCCGCGRFLTEYQVYAVHCPNCGADNTP